MGKRLHESSALSTADANVDVDAGADTEDKAPPPRKVTVGGGVAGGAGSSTDTGVIMQCTLPPHHHEASGVSFSTIEAFEAHYAKEHSNRCISCSKNFPSGHFLSLHLDEHHNPLREEREAKGEKTYGCFVEGCEKLCSSAQKRRLHLIDKHAFPRVYNFRVIETGIDKSTSMLVLSAAGGGGSRRGRLSTTSLDSSAALASVSISASASDTASSPTTKARQRRRLGSGTAMAAITKTTPPTATTLSPQESRQTQSLQMPDDPVDELEKSMSALRFVPPSLARQRGRKPQG